MFRGANDLLLPVEFSGPAQLILYTRYDDPRNAFWEQKWIVNWKVNQLHPWFPKEEIKVHKHFKPMLEEAFFELEQLGLQQEIKSFHRSYEVTALHNSPVLSVHSWGAGIDLNEEDNPRGSIGTWSEDFLAVMKRHEIFCGQEWTGNKEPMHFAMVNG